MNHKDLDAWKFSIKFVEEIYKISSFFPKEEIYSLTSQIRRASVSIPSNIAEGASRQSNKEFIQFLYISLGSLSEVETQLIIAKNLGYIDGYDSVEKQMITIRKIILGLIKFLKG
jgi:four helix bundle protein